MRNVQEKANGRKVQREKNKRQEERITCKVIQMGKCAA